MPHIARVSRRTWRARLAYAGMYAVLAAGTAAVALPLLVLAARSVATPRNLHTFSLVPRYLYDDTDLFRNYLATKYGTMKEQQLNTHYGTNFHSYTQVDTPAAVSPALVGVWQSMRDTLPTQWKLVAFNNRSNQDVLGPAQRLYQKFLYDRYHGSLDELNRAYGQKNTTFNWLQMPRTQQTSATHCMPDDAITRDFRSFKAALPGRYFLPIPVERNWQKYLQGTFGTVAAFNRACGTRAAAFTLVTLPEHAPARTRYRRVWERFVRTQCPPMFIFFDDDALPSYRRMLARRYGRIARYNRRHGTSHASFAAVDWPRSRSLYGFGLADWTEFRRVADTRYLAVRCTAGHFRSTLLNRYGSVDGVNRALGTAYTSAGAIVPPLRQADWLDMHRDMAGWRRYYLACNYTEVWRAMLTIGRPLTVTGIYLLGLIIAQVALNTLAAYALSRFRLRYAYRVLAFFLATMAFPVEVTMIPNFLLLKQLNLLNTFWALILPLAVNGYFIFVLKGFFDTIPHSLYEAASLDGLSEPRIFRQITVPLSRPVIAWLALQAFMIGYNQFLFSMVVCQDARMWTLMVWMYEMFNWAQPGMISAAAVLAAVPGVVVFLFAQRIIVRGVVIPLDQ